MPNLGRRSVWPAGPDDCLFLTGGDLLHWKRQLCRRTARRRTRGGLVRRL